MRDRVDVVDSLLQAVAQAYHAHRLDQVLSADMFQDHRENGV